MTTQKVDNLTAVLKKKGELVLVRFSLILECFTAGNQIDITDIVVRSACSTAVHCCVVESWEAYTKFRTLLSGLEMPRVAMLRLTDMLRVIKLINWDEVVLDCTITARPLSAVQRINQFRKCCCNKMFPTTGQNLDFFFTPHLGNQQSC